MQTKSLARALRLAALPAAAVLLASCGLVTKDIPVAVMFQVGDALSLTSFSQTQITAPLESSAGDLGALSSVVMNSAVLQSTDGTSLSFITGGSITISGTSSSGAALPTVQLATLNPPGMVGITNFTIESEPDLRPYLEGTSQISFTLDYPTPPVPARALELTLNIHATL